MNRQNDATPRKRPTKRAARPAATPAPLRPTATAPTRATGFRALPLVAIVAAAIVVGALVFFIAGGGLGGGAGANDEPGTDGVATGGDGRVSFVAVGDSLTETAIGEYADACAGEVGDGAYDYRPLFAAIKPYIETADVAYIKQEVHLGGDDIGPRGWPSFNVTDAMADAVVDAGFDFVASASNHAYDWGYFGAVEHSRSIWNEQPVAFTGTATSDEEAAEIATVERNGITFALLDYTYGVNGYTQADLPAYAVNFIDEDRIATDVARAREVADVVIVAMHWGTENLMEADADQQRYAQLLADLNVDLVLGSHPHVIGPLAWVEGASGHRTLVAYSLGNFVSNHEAPLVNNEFGGMLSCDFVKTDGAVSIENVVWTPIVNHTEPGAYSVYALPDYTEELAARHTYLSTIEDPIGQIRSITRDVIGDEFAIADE